MRKTSSLAGKWMKDWPRPEQIEQYFLSARGRREFFEEGDGGGLFDADGIDGTEGLGPRQGSNVSLMISAHPTWGVYVQWRKWDGKRPYTFHARGDLTRLWQLVRDMQDTPLPVGLLVPFEVAWKAVKEFLETDGQLPKSIEWVDDEDLPSDIFLDPHDPIVEDRLISWD